MTTIEQAKPHTPRHAHPATTSNEHGRRTVFIVTVGAMLNMLGFAIAWPDARPWALTLAAIWATSAAGQTINVIRRNRRATQPAQ